MGGLMILGPDFREFVEFCEQNDVRYLIVGGFAAGVHGHVRYTKDLDIWIEPTVGNSRLVIDVLRQFGFGELGLCAADFQAPGNVIQLGYPPNRLDLLTQPSGVSFDDCWSRRIRVDLGGVTANVIGFDDLIANKRASGRLRDLADIEDLNASD